MRDYDEHSRNPFETLSPLGGGGGEPFQLPAEHSGPFCYPFSLY